MKILVATTMIFVLIPLSVLAAGPADTFPVSGEWKGNYQTQITEACPSGQAGNAYLHQTGDSVDPSSGAITFYGTLILENFNNFGSTEVPDYANGVDIGNSVVSGTLSPNSGNYATSIYPKTDTLSDNSSTPGYHPSTHDILIQGGVCNITLHLIYQ